MPPRVNPNIEELNSLSLNQLKRLLIRVRRSNDASEYQINAEQIIDELNRRSLESREKQKRRVTDDDSSDCESSGSEEDVQDGTVISFNDSVLVDGRWFYSEEESNLSLDNDAGDEIEVKIPESASCPKFPTSTCAKSVQQWICEVRGKYKLARFLFRGKYRFEHIRLWVGNASTNELFSNAVGNCDQQSDLEAILRSIARIFNLPDGSNAGTLIARFKELTLPRKNEAILPYWQRFTSFINMRKQIKEDVISEQELVNYLLKLGGTSLYLDLQLMSLSFKRLRISTHGSDKVLEPLVPGSRMTLERIVFSFQIALQMMSSHQMDAKCTRVEPEQKQTDARDSSQTEFAKKGGQSPYFGNEAKRRKTEEH